LAVPKMVTQIINRYLQLADKQLPNYIKSFFIYGSLSLDAFVDGISDIDFVAVVDREVSDENIETLKNIHGTIKKEFPKTDLMGLYITAENLRQIRTDDAQCHHFIDGKYKGLIKFDRNSIDAYQLKRYGIAIRGMKTENLDYEVDWDILLAGMKNNLNTYWVKWVNRCRRFSIFYIGLLFDLKLVEWGVLGVTRLYYSFYERDITSKLGAGKYALEKMPQRWHRIIRESMKLRQGKQKSYYRSIIKRRADALNYMEYVINEINSTF
jgi:hypothetical protein